MVHARFILFFIVFWNHAELDAMHRGRRVLKKSAVQKKSVQQMEEESARKKQEEYEKKRNERIKEEKRKEENGRLLIPAIKENDTKKLEKLLQEGADVDYCDEEGNSPLTTAIFLNQKTIVKGLLLYGAEARAGKNNPLLIAYMMAQPQGRNGKREDYIQRVEIILLLKDHIKRKYPDLENQSCKADWKYLDCECQACVDREKEECMYDPHVRCDDDIDKAIMEEQKCIQVSDLLLDDFFGAEENEKNHLLLKAIEQDELPRVNALLDEGADVNYCDGEGNSPLATAIFLRRVSIVERLLLRGVNVRPFKNNPCTVAYYMSRLPKEKDLITYDHVARLEIYKSLFEQLKKSCAIGILPDVKSYQRGGKCDCEDCVGWKKLALMIDPHLQSNQNRSAFTRAADLVKNLYSIDAELPDQNQGTVPHSFKKPVRQQPARLPRVFPVLEDPDDVAAKFDAMMDYFIDGSE